MSKPAGYAKIKDGETEMLCKTGLNSDWVPLYTLDHAEVLIEAIVKMIASGPDEWDQLTGKQGKDVGYAAIAAYKEAIK